MPPVSASAACTIYSPTRPDYSRLTGLWTLPFSFINAAPCFTIPKRGFFP